MEIREETAADFEGIREVNRLAFGDDGNVARMVDALRDEGYVIASLIAVEGDQILGHVMFTDTPLTTPRGELPGGTLSPLAVIPERQKQGIGSELVRRGIELLHDRGYAAIIMIGHPEYYPRFGFSSALARKVESKYSTIADPYMALELIPGALADGASARVPATFERFE